MDLSSLNLESNFTGLDWAIVAVYLLATVVIGVYVNRYITNMGDYVVAGRAVRSFLGIATMIGTEFGLVTVMYMAQKGVTGGFAAFHIALAAGIGTLIVGLTGFIVVPLRRLGVMTIPEFYERRFSRGVRVFGGVILAVSGILNMGLFLKVGATFVTGLTGLESTLHLKIVMTVLLALVLTYTILGGMVSVVITDYMQFVVLAFGLLLACALAVNGVGWSNITDAAVRIYGEAGLNPFAGDSGFGVEYVAWMIFSAGIIASAVWPTAVMRACAAENERVVRRLYTWSSIGFMIRSLIPMFLGVCAVAYFRRHPDAAGVMFSADGSLAIVGEDALKLLPMFLSQVLPVGLIGLIGAGMLAAFMSTHDSYLLCWASVIVQDVVDPLVPGGMSVKTRLTLARLLIFLTGVFLLVFGLWYEMENQDVFDYLWVTGAIFFTGAFALLAVGLYWKRASTLGAYLALLAGVTAVLGLEPVAKLVRLDGYMHAWGPPRYAAIVGLASTACAIGLLVIGSLIKPDPPRQEGVS